MYYGHCAAAPCLKLRCDGYKYSNNNALLYIAIQKNQHRIDSYLATGMKHDYGAMAATEKLLWPKSCNLLLWRGVLEELSLWENGRWKTSLICMETEARGEAGL